jgi:hypothetical protein
VRRGSRTGDRARQGESPGAAGETASATLRGTETAISVCAHALHNGCDRDPGVGAGIRRRRGSGDAIDIRASAVLRADVATAWQVLTDYDRYVDFIPDLRTSRVVARHGGTVTVEQSGDAMLWLLRMPLDITFEIEEAPPRRIRSQAIGGSLRALTSDYALVPTDAGLRLDYVGRIAPGFELFGHLELIAVRDNIARQFQALADEIERRSASAMHGDPTTSQSPVTRGTENARH